MNKKTCNISVGRVFNGSEFGSPELANKEAVNEGYEFFIFGDTVYITRNPLMFSAEKDSTSYSSKELIDC